jgi:hypothetical protein
VTAFAPLLGLLEEVPDHRRAEGKVYQLAHVLLFSILAIVSGGNSYRSIATWLLMGSGVMVRRSCRQRRDEGAEESFAPAPGVVHELKEAKVERQLFL